MANSYFQFKQFTIHQDRCAMKVTTDGCLFGAWVAEQVKSEKEELKKLLDIGAGTGLLSLMTVQHNPKFVIDAVELDKNAYEQAKENVAHSAWKDRVDVIHADIKEFSSSTPYDIIISNPPFYENELRSINNQKNKAHHDEGLLLNDLLIIIKKHLQPDGKFYLLLPYKRNAEIDSIIKENGLSITHKLLAKQSTGHHYFRVMIIGQHQQQKENNYTSCEITVRNEKNEYTPEFISLLKDYYLHL